MDNQNNPWLSTSDVVLELGLTHNQIRALVRAGKLDAEKRNGRYYYLRSKLDEFKSRDWSSLEELTVDNKECVNATSILFLAADPTDDTRLRLGEEFREIQEKLKLAKLRDSYRLELPQLSIRPADISQALLDIQPHIVHFSGHGIDTGALCFENQIGERYPIQPAALAALFEQFADQVNCVVLNACYSEVQAKAIAKYIDYVVGMNQAIGDRAAISFAIGFYQALGAGRTIEEAYKFGCVQIGLQSIPEHLTPVLIKKKKILRKSGTRVPNHPHDAKPKRMARRSLKGLRTEHGSYERLSPRERRRRQAVRGDDLKYYFYLSEIKVDMLYNQLGGADSALTKYQKLSVILKRLEQKGAIGTSEEPRSYFAGVLDMRWRVIEDHTNQIEVVFFLAQLSDKIIGLGGSPTHLLGHAHGSGQGSSTAATQAALKYILRMEETMRQAGEAIQPEDTDPEDAQMIEDWKSLLMRTSQSFVFWSGSGVLPERLEFVAKTLVTQEGILLGTPLYVALS